MYFASLNLLLIAAPDCDVKGLQEFFKLFVHVPRPNFGERQLLWRHYIQHFKGAVTPALDLGTLALVSDWYTPRVVCHPQHSRCRGADELRF